MSEQFFNCPSCGAELQRKLAHTKLVTCDYCDSTVMLEDEAVRLAGKSGVMAEYPSILRMHKTFTWRGRSLTPQGHARFKYAHGFWDEWWAMEGGDGVWISIDEGDIAIEEPLDAQGLDIGRWADLRIGAALSLAGGRFVVSELGSAEVEAVRGELPELLTVGQRFDYAHLSGSEARLITLEREDGEITATEGLWVDPFEIETA